jgi:hypothetical protein
VSTEVAEPPAARGRAAGRAGHRGRVRGGHASVHGPEQAAGEADAEHRTDIHAFGMLPCELLTGDVPFASRSGVALLAAQLVERREPVAA